jgi:hypothetical protein
MPRYWLLCLSEDNYLITREYGLIGMSRRAKATIQLGLGTFDSDLKAIR